MFFFQLCKVQKLNPFLKEAYIIKYGNQPATIVTDYKVLQQIADRSGVFDGIEIQAVNSFESAQERVKIKVNEKKEITTILKPHFADFNDVNWSIDDDKLVAVKKESGRIIDENQNSITDTWEITGLKVGETKMNITSDSKDVTVLIEVVQDNKDKNDKDNNDKDDDKNNDKNDDSDKSNDNDIPDGGFDYKIGIVTLVMAILLGLLYRRLKV